MRLVKSLMILGVWLPLSTHGALPAICESRLELAHQFQYSITRGHDFRFGFLEKADRILVYKNARELFLLRQNQIIGHYRVSLGFSPLGQKQQQGDGRTPEGRYFISFKNVSSKYHLGLKVSYPDAADKEWAKKQGMDPGGEIYIHGWPVDPKEKAEVAPIHGKLDWTYGCVAVTDPEIEDIWARVDIGTVIDLCPSH